MTKKLSAEFLGTFWLVFGGCGTAIFAGSHVGFLGVALAFGLTVLTMAFAIGPISGCHLNPAVSVGLVAAGRFDKRELLPYILAQCLGAIVAATILYVILTSKVGGDIGSFAANGYGLHSPDGFGMAAAMIAELILTFMFVMVILGSTHPKAAVILAPIAIGLCLTLIHLISIPITNTSVNPARSLGPALYVGGWALEQLWLFILMPLLGGLLAGLVWKYWNKDNC